MLSIKTEGLTGEALSFANNLNDSLKQFKQGVSEEQLNTAIEAVKSSYPKNFITQEKLSEEIEGLKSILAAQGTTISGLKNVSSTSPISFKEAIKCALEENKESLKGLKNRKAGYVELSIKAPATMTVATNTGQPNAYLPVPQFMPGVVDLVRNKPLFMDYLNTGNASSSRIVWTEKTNVEGNAQFIGEGDLKPLVGFEFKSNISEAKKVAAVTKVSEEMLDDIDFISAEINNELRYQVDIKTDNDTLTGDGTGDNLKGITEYAAGYVLTAVETTAIVNNSDAIRAAITQINSLNFSANYAFVNPIDAANMDLAKSTTGEYVLPPFSSLDGRNIAGVRVVESNQIPVGYLLVMDSTRVFVRTWKDFFIRVGYENDDIRKNLVTIIGEKRMHLYIPDNYTGALVYDTFANIKAAITAP